MCAIIGIFGNDDAATMTYYGLYALLHRGQDGAGIATSNGSSLRLARVQEEVKNFTARVLADLPGTLAIGHNRYPTVGDGTPANIQPILIECKHGQIAIAHNGQFTNAAEIREELETRGAIFQTSTDTEVFLHLFARSKTSVIEDALVEASLSLTGAFSLVLMTKDSLIAIRDPHGMRPLSLAKLGQTWVVASETCAFDLLGATYKRDIEPGEILIISRQGTKSIKPFAQAKLAHCIFEHVYFSRPDSFVFGQSVSKIRANLGRTLAREQPAKADLVVSVPDSGRCAAEGFAEESGLPLRMGLIRNHYVGRSFIQPHQTIRNLSVKVKLNADRNILHGQRVVLVDDSIVRGTTSKQIVNMVRAAGATEVHLRISCPSIISPCYYGINTPERLELIAATHTEKEIRNFVGADSVGYLSLEGMLNTLGRESNSYCSSCYTGLYPLPVPKKPFTT